MFFVKSLVMPFIMRTMAIMSSLVFFFSFLMTLFLLSNKFFTYSNKPIFTPDIHNSTILLLIPRDRGNIYINVWYIFYILYIFILQNFRNYFKKYGFGH